MAKLIRKLAEWFSRKEADRQKKQCAITLAAKKYDLNKICLNCGNVACSYYRYARTHGFFDSVLDVSARAEKATGDDIQKIINDCLADDPTQGEDF